MNNPLDNFKNPFDIDGEYAKRILNSDTILDSSKILNIDILKQNIESPTEDKEKYFVSAGTKPLKRYYQALKYKKKGIKIDIYGMDCNACCMMYFLQSYGLIPPFMNRKQFEYAFTPLYPNFTKHITVNEIKAYLKDNPLKLTGEDSIFSPLVLPEGYTLPAKTNILDGVFPSTENFCRGRAGAIFPQLDNATNQLLTFCNKFYDLSQEKGYEFMQEFRKSSYFNLNYMGLKNKYEDLVNGITDKKYFEDNVIFVGLYHYYPYPGHYCIIVNTPKETTINETEFWIYPADDPLFGVTNIFVPKSIINIENFRDAVNADNTNNRLIYSNCAIGV